MINFSFLGEIIIQENILLACRIPDMTIFKSLELYRILDGLHQGNGGQLQRNIFKIGQKIDILLDILKQKDFIRYIFILIGILSSVADPDCGQVQIHGSGTIKEGFQRNLKHSFNSISNTIPCSRYRALDLNLAKMTIRNTGIRDFYMEEFFLLNQMPRKSFPQHQASIRNQ